MISRIIMSNECQTSRETIFVRSFTHASRFYIFHRSSIVQNLIRDYEILPLEIECTGCLFSCATTPLSEFFSTSPISRFRSQFSADLFARHAYSSLKLFALSTFSPCTLIHRFAFRNGFARETSPPMNARTPVALTDSFILVYLCPGFFLPFFILRDLTYETIIIFFDL